MAAVFSTFLRGLVGIAASIALVAVTWTLYVQRESVAKVTAPLARLLAPAQAPGAAAPPTAATPTRGKFDAAQGAQPAAGTAAAPPAPDASGAPPASAPAEEQDPAPVAGAPAPGKRP